MVDLSLYSSQDLRTYPQFLTCLAADLLDKLDLDVRPPSEIPSQPEMSRFIQRSILRVVAGNVVFAFDEVDRILGQEYQSDFFTMLRYWHERRAEMPATAWANLELALVVSTEPYLLIEDPNRSPFNVRAPVTLDGFSLEECFRLNRLYNDFLSEAQVKELWSLVGGHPYLMRLAYYRLTGPVSVPFATLARDAAEDDGPFGDHLRALLAKLKLYPGQNLLAAMRRVATRGSIPEDCYYRLSAAGLVRKEKGGGVRPSSQLYARFFGGLM
jgi:hypothetical protein